MFRQIRCKTPIDDRPGETLKQKEAHSLILVPALQRDARLVKLALIMNDNLLALFTHHQSRGPPRKVVHLPERVQWQKEGENGNGENVENHPGNHVPPHAEDEDEGLKAVDRCEHDDGEHGDGAAFADDEVKEVSYLKRVSAGALLTDLERDVLSLLLHPHRAFHRER